MLSHTTLMFVSCQDKAVGELSHLAAVAALKRYKEREGHFALCGCSFFCRIVSNWFKFMPASVSRKQTVVRMIVVRVPSDIRSLCAGLEGRLMSVLIKANFKGSKLTTAFFFRRSVAGLCLGGFNRTHDC